MELRKSILLFGAALALAACEHGEIISFPDGGPLPPEDAGSPVDTGPPPVVESCVAPGGTIGTACSADGTCDDGCFCNGVERCVDGTCAAAADPCLDDIECTLEACNEELNRCAPEPQHGMCGNGNACDGSEICDLTVGCSPGTPPFCNDENSCTIDSCDPAEGCRFDMRDLDADGYIDGHCGGDDCDDDPRFGRDIHPGATELCRNRRDDDCDGARDFLDSEDCIATNDTCADAELLPGPGTYSGSTVSLSSDYDVSCQRDPGPDSVFTFELTEMQDVTVTLSGGGAGAGIALRTEANCETGPDVRCATGTPPRFLQRSLEPGVYAIIVQSPPFGFPFDLSLRYGPPTEIPAYDVCGPGTEDICGGTPCTTLDATFSGMFLETEDDYDPSCSGEGARDAVYQFTITAPKDVTLSVTTEGSEPFLPATVASLTTNCSEPSGELRCSVNTPVLIRQRNLSPGTYFIIIESTSEDPSSWDLSVTIADPTPRNPGDACETAVDISEAVLGEGGAGVVDGSMLEMDVGTTCSGDGFGADANFFFTLPETRDVTVTTSTGGGGRDFSFAALQTVCGRNTSELRCWNGVGTLNQTFRSLEPGTYWITVVPDFAAGLVSASIFTDDPTPIPPNDRCGGAIAISGGARRSDTLEACGDDGISGDCGFFGPGIDAFYSIHLDAASTVLVSIDDADAPESFFTLTLLSGCGGSVIECGSGEGSATVTETLEPGDYIIMVEAAGIDESDYTLFAFELPP